MKAPFILCCLLGGAALWSGCNQSDAPGAFLSETDKGALWKFLHEQSGQKKFAPTFDFDLGTRQLAARAKANDLEAQIAAQRQQRLALENSLEPRKKELEELRQKTRDAKTLAAGLKEKIAALDKTADDPNLARLRTDLDAANVQWQTLRKSSGELETALETERKKIRESAPPPDETLQTKLEAARAASRELHEQAGRQENEYINWGRSQASNAPSYQAIYKLIGEQLTVSDRLLSDTNQSRQRMGVYFAKEAARHAADAAQHAWLAARICEHYLWPHLEVVDYNPGAKGKANDLLDMCRSYFSMAEETNKVIRNAELRVTHAESPDRADARRLNLAELLMEKGDYRESAKVLREIKSTKHLPEAEKHLAALKPRL